MESKKHIDVNVTPSEFKDLVQELMFERNDTVTKIYSEGSDVKDSSVQGKRALVYRGIRFIEQI